MAGIKLGTVVLALALVGLPFAVTAAELPVTNIHKFRTAHHWRVRHEPSRLLLVSLGLEMGRHPVFLVRVVVRVAMIAFGA